MLDLTIEDVRAAQGNDLAATATVITATESRVGRLAATAAQRMGYQTAEYREEFEQVGRIAVWESLKRFDGETVDDFYAFVYRTVENALMDAVRSERNGATGADADAMKVFASMLTVAGGDVYLAERISQTLPPKGRRLGPDRANAARMAWQGTVSVDAPTGAAEGRSYAETLATDYGIPEDLITSGDITSERKREKHALVHAVLDTMSHRYRHVVKASFGIDPVPLYGHGRVDNNDDELAADMGLSVKQVRDSRKLGMQAFEKRYGAAMGWAA